MKKSLIICVILILWAGMEGFAQKQFRKPLKSSSQSIAGFSDYNVGLKLGCPWSYMPKSDLNEVTYDGHIGYLIGVTGERNFGKLSVGAELSFAQKGTKMHNEKEYQIALDSTGLLRTYYSTAYNVASLRIPVTYYFKGLIKNDVVVPYIFAGPEIDIALPFNINLSSFSIDTTIWAVTEKFDGPSGENPFSTNKDAFVPPLINVSAVAGLGVMTKIRIENTAIIIKFDAAVNCGLLNLAATPTTDGWKWPFQEQEKKIFSHDAEVNLTIVYPIKKILRDACYSFRKK